jgi:hypothetical protein
MIAMNKIYFLFLIVLVSVSTVKAVDIVVTESKVKFSHGKFNAVQVQIPGVLEKDVLKAWANKMKDLKGKIKTSRHGVEAAGATYFDINHYPGNFYAETKLVGGIVELSVAVDLDGKYIKSSDNMKAYNGLKSFMVEFSKGLIREQVQKELAAAEKLLKKQQKALEKLKKKKLNLKEDVVGCQEDIKLAENEIIQNDLSQKNQVDVIIRQQQEVEAIKKKQLEI